MKIPKSCRWQSTGRNLGAGGAAEVVEVIDTLEENRKPAALKALRPNKQAALYTRFRNEMAALKHLMAIQGWILTAFYSLGLSVIVVLDSAFGERQVLLEIVIPFVIA